MTQETTILATEFPTAAEAIQYAEAGGGVAIVYRGQNLVAKEADVRTLAESGEEFAYLHDHEMRDGTHRIVTIPVN